MMLCDIRKTRRVSVHGVGAPMVETPITQDFLLPHFGLQFHPDGSVGWPCRVGGTLLTEWLTGWMRPRPHRRHEAFAYTAFPRCPFSNKWGGFPAVSAFRESGSDQVFITSIENGTYSLSYEEDRGWTAQFYTPFPTRGDSLLKGLKSLPVKFDDYGSNQFVSEQAGGVLQLLTNAKEAAIKIDDRYFEKDEFIDVELYGYHFVKQGCNEVSVTCGDDIRVFETDYNFVGNNSAGWFGLTWVERTGLWRSHREFTNISI
ncbi:MAG: hypothetical protein KDD84_07765 [Caldilineaceae bacterium]|nr:hypothetical protein [Caldilineaceae bacterium]